MAPVNRAAYTGASPQPIQPTPPLQTPTPQVPPFPQPQQPVPPQPPQQPVPVPLNPAPPPSPEPAQPAQFTPPPAKKKSRRRLVILILLGLLLVAGIIVGVLYYLRLQAEKNDPDRVFKEALAYSLSTTKLQADTTTAAGTTSQTKYDFTKRNDPTISNEASLKLAGSSFNIAAYGSTKNTYISYEKLPSVVKPDLVKTVQGSWVQLRDKGRLPTGVNSTLANLADPRYQAFGIIMLGNYSEQARTQLVNFMLANRVYTYNKTAVQQKAVGDQEMFIYPVKLNISYLKIANQSAAASNKFVTEDVKAAVDALGQIKGATATMYVSAKDHRLQRLELVGSEGQTTTVYSHYNQLDFPVEPQTKLTWKDFSPAYTQITAQTTAAQPKGLTKPSN